LEFVQVGDVEIQGVFSGGWC